MNSPDFQRVGSTHTIAPFSEQHPQQIFCDGVSSFSLGVINCKLDLHQVVAFDSNGEKRKVIQKLVIPTTALVELCHLVLKGINQNSSGLKNLLEQHSQMLFSTLPDQSSTPSKVPKNK